MKATSILAGLLAIALATGCTQATAGKERPTPGLTPRPLKGETVKQVLLDGAALSKILGQQFEQIPEWPSAFGGAEALQPPETVSLPDCVGVTRLTDRHPYQSANVQNVARQYWWAIVTAEAKVLRVSLGVVALPTAAEATALFGKFSAQWDKCQGQTVTIDGNPVAFSDKITDVRVANSVLAATVLHEVRVAGKPNSSQVARAIGVRVNCLVEVFVDFFDTIDLADPGTGDIHTTAIDLAHTLMDRVSALS